MKLAFSTLACPTWTIDTVARTAADLGYDAVELRLLDGRDIDPVSDQARVSSAVASCRAAGVDICAVDTTCTFNHADSEERMRQVTVLLRWIDLAAANRVRVLRVFAGSGDPSTGSVPANDATVMGWIVESLRRAAPAAAQAGVTIALETHDSFSSSERVAQALDAVDSPWIAALWDSHHPYRMGESNEQVVGVLDSRIAHVHVKDARRLEPNGSTWQLVPLGEGEVPVAGMLRLLRERGYEGYVSVEWEKRWHPELAEPEVALPQHIAWLRGHC
jgi:sugar phosphate isomerase/epimerase